MIDTLREIFAARYAPHGYCLLWEPWLVWSHVISDALIALAYFSIPLALLVFVRRRKDIAFGFVFWAFAIFITACGLTHLVRIWTLWHGDYGIEAVIKVVTATVSVATAIGLWPLLPKLLALPSPAQLRAVNEALRAEILQRERAEAALLEAHRMEAIGRLSGGIAHNFNNILQVIGGSLNIISLRAHSDQKLRALADNATRSIERGVRLTNQLLSFSEVQSLAPEQIRVPELASDLHALVFQSLPPGIALQIKGEDLPLCIEADAMQLELSLLALVLNAQEAMTDGGQLTITFAKYIATPRDELASGDYLRMTIGDTGVGMAPDVLEHVFEPFFTTKPPTTSSGLGLSIVHEMARRSGGTTRIESVPSIGTSVSMFLPIAECQTVASPIDAELDPALRTRLEGLRIMVVDDEPATRAIVAMTLENLGCIVTQAESGVQALAASAGDRPDTFVLDFSMNGMNGAELAAALRRRDPDCAIVFLTGFADTDAIEAAVGKNPIILRKPASMHQLAHAVDRCLSLPHI